MGKVYLIGAGPGDEELITVKAIKAIEKCDVLLYDRLATKSLLRYAKDGCEIYYCGKTPNNHYKKQEEINEMLIYFAKLGKVVGRVKGGDSYIFGRGGEEAIAVMKEGIEFETVSGVTSPSAVLNYAGIPLTHRGISQSFHIFTAMSAEKLEIDWEAVVKLRGTIVFMMGLSNLELITEKLIEAGKSEETPAAVVMKGTTSKQKKVIGNIKDITEKVKKAGLESPCIIAFGDTIELNEKLDWYSKKPLFGMNICITRSKKQSGELREKLSSLGAEVTEINSIKTEKIEDSIKPYIKNLDFYDYIILNSVNAVDYFFTELIERNIDIRRISAKFPAIGQKTAEAIKRRGIVPFFTAKEFTLEGLYDSIKGKVRKNEKVLIPKSESGRPFLIEKLKEDGLKVDSFNLYKTICGEKGIYQDLEGVDIIIFTSPSTVRNMIDMYGRDEIKKKRLLSIGPITGKELDFAGLKYSVSDSYSIDGIVDKLKEYADNI